MSNGPKGNVRKIILPRREVVKMLKKLFRKAEKPEQEKSQDFANEIGFAVIFDVDYLHNNETSAKLFFNAIHQLLIMKGFNFEGRIFYRLGSFEAVESALKESVLAIKNTHGLEPKLFVRAVHVIPLSQFTDLTRALTQL